MQRVIEGSSQAQSLMLVPYVVVLAVVGLSFVGATLAATTLSHSPPAPTEPFSAYLDVFPGQAQTAAETRGFLCIANQRSYYLDSLDTHCVQHPVEGPFSSIDVAATKGMIHQTSFLARENALLAGDLALFLGSTDFHFNPHVLTFSWQGYAGLASTHYDGGRFSLFRPVWNVTFTDTPLAANWQKNSAG